MKKYIAIAIIGIGFLALAEEYPAQDKNLDIQQYAEYAKVSEWVGTFGTTVATQYVGVARTTKTSAATPSTNASVWRITKTVFAADGLTITSKQVSRASDGRSFGESWTNRVSATYR